MDVLNTKYYLLALHNEFYRLIVYYQEVLGNVLQISKDDFVKLDLKVLSYKNGKYMSLFEYLCKEVGAAHAYTIVTETDLEKYAY